MGLGSRSAGSGLIRVSQQISVHYGRTVLLQYYVAVRKQTTGSQGLRGLATFGIAWGNNCNRFSFFFLPFLQLFHSTYLTLYLGNTM